jgi:hypothetical protein
LTQEKEIAVLKRSKAAWRAGCVGTGGAFLIVLLILVL